ncbi:HDOD domain-containing protein [Vibrio sp. SM6]|uniref:HDOD domain-containing protein n=1 Tax=Vibrio agarilyticus TaxID=2726741 RepID=A0A7X8YGH8_9VIBR|nr:HDOD domain-containing protein [Vibrio agarilyticus]NLS12565.1 HDOD domain-containing protein [Vibrio agarilyticus]
MLSRHKRFTEEATQAVRQIDDEVTLRHAKWLVSHNHRLNQKDVDQVLSLQSRFCEDVIFSEKERINRNQRILLECEGARVREKILQQESHQHTLKHVVRDVTKLAQQNLIKKLRHEPLEKNLISSLPQFSQLADVAYSSSTSFNQLNQLVTNDPHLGASLVDVASNRVFSKRLGRKTRVVDGPKMALGQLGIDRLRILLPLLMARPIPKWRDKRIRHIASKMWHHMVVTANVTRMRLAEVNAKEPNVGILIGVLRTFGQYIVLNHYCAAFEDALIETMLRYRKENRQECYYACPDVSVNLAGLPSLIKQLEAPVSQRLLAAIEWQDSTKYIRTAVQEDISAIDIWQRSHFGAALAQGRAFSIFDGLHSSRAFNEKHKPYWFSNVQISANKVKELKLKTPGQLTMTL